MKFQFNPNQEYQLSAISAAANLFKGQDSSLNSSFGIGGKKIGSLKEMSSEKAGHTLGYGNTLTLDNEQLNKNLKSIQHKNQIFSQENIESKGKNFSVEMETGTGKTYVYLRTIFELNKQYNWTKFIIVVPSIAVREGVLKSLEIMKSHFEGLYNKIPYSQFVYQSKKTSLLRNFATASQLQIMLINIDSFNKDSNIIRLDRDQTGGIKPIEFIKNIRPIVIIDEPQNMESEKSQQAIESLNPLFTLRYSATHRNLYNPIYSLNPVQAFQKKLVKKISVASVVEENDPTQAYIKVLKIQNRKNKITCSLQFFQNTQAGRKLIKKVCKQNDDLYMLSKENIIYKNGFKVNEINCKPGIEFIRFSNGVKLSLGKEQGGYREDIIKTQIRETIKAHFQKEIQLKNQGIKVLSLFFLDRVENYRLYQKGQNSLGVYGKWFEEIYTKLSKEYKELKTKPVKEVHNGYFSKDKKGILKNTKGNTKEDENTYNLIMRDKERLLDTDNPLKFIFSHSALREGWDNPNIFQICTLNETSSTLKKRQEIGRGLRLPVNQTGERIQDDLINNLVVVANESYEDFVQNLQKELEEDTGFTFGSLPVNAFIGISFESNGKTYKINQEESKEIWNHFKKLNYISDNGYISKAFYQSVQDKSCSVPKKFNSALNSVIQITEQHQLESHIQKHKNKKKASLNEKALLDPEFKKFWEAISQKTIYSVHYDTQELIKKAGTAIKNMEKIPPLSIFVNKADINIESKGVTAQLTKTPDHYSVPERTKIPDILSYIQERVLLTRRTIFKILKKSGRLNKDFTANPQKFMDLAVKEIKNVLHHLIIKGIQYEKLKGSSYEMSRFDEEKHKMEFSEDQIIPTKKSVYDYIYYESGVEKNFAVALENMQNIKYFIKLPNWFKVRTPVGNYNPDWAILKKNGDIVYMIRETKFTLDKLGLRALESKKIQCGKAHFESIGVNYKTCTSIENADL